MTNWSVLHTMNATTDNPIHEIIIDRGQDVATFTKPDITKLHDPGLMKDMDAGTDIVVSAIRNGQKIRIMGDYDADGISSTTVGMILLEEAGADVSYDIPDRKDGYGLSRKLVDKAYQDGVEVIVTCDNGVAAFDAVDYANSLGLTVVVTDHHEPQETLPNCLVINPMQRDCPYPFKKLSGCAVMWKFCQNVLGNIQGTAGILKSYDVIDIVAIGTVADVMDLIGENRIIVHYGVKRLNKTENIGLQELYKALELDIAKYPIEASTIGFKIGPALNATGRLVSAKEAVEMLLQKSRLKAMRSARYLAQLNEERKAWTKEWFEKALEYFGEEPSDKILVFKAEHIPEGIVGNIASKIKEHYNRPVLIMTRDESGEFYKGSGRSIPTYNLFHGIMSVRELFIAAGGHSMACGFSIHTDQVHFMIEKLNASCTLTDEDLIPTLLIDYDVDPSILDIQFAEELLGLAPFGKGNPKPKFMMTDVVATEYKAMGANKTHLKMTVMVDGRAFECVGWNMYEDFDRLARAYNGQNIFLDIAFTPGINEWNGKKTLQLMLEDFRVARS